MLITAILDACVLFPAPLRDTLLRAAKAKLYNVRLTDEILEEVERNHINKRKLTEIQAQRLLFTIKAKFEGKFVTDYQAHIDAMPINEKDRHILAAAVAGSAQIIVAHNLKHFPPDLLTLHKVEAQPPDKFLLQLSSSNPEELEQVLLNPPMTIADVLDRLSLDAPNFVCRMRERFGYSNPQ